MKALARLTMRWSGVAPRVGQYLKTPRGRMAYEISSLRRVEPTRNSRGLFPTFGQTKYILMCRRVEPKEVPTQATVHMFAWNQRRRRPR